MDKSASNFIKRLSERLVSENKKEYSDLQLLNVFQLIISQLDDRTIKSAIAKHADEYFTLFTSEYEKNKKQIDLKNDDKLNDNFQFKIDSNTLILLGSKYHSINLNLKTNVNGIIIGKGGIFEMAKYLLSSSDCINSLEIYSSVANFNNYSLYSSGTDILNAKFLLSLEVRACLLAYSDVFSSRFNNNNDKESNSNLLSLLCRQSSLFAVYYISFLGFWLSKVPSSTTTILNSSLLPQITSELSKFQTQEFDIPSSEFSFLFIGMLLTYLCLSKLCEEKNETNENIQNLLRLVSSQLRRTCEMHVSPGISLWKDKLLPLLSNHSTSFVASHTLPQVCKVDCQLITKDFLLWFTQIKDIHSYSTEALKQWVFKECDMNISSSLMVDESENGNEDIDESEENINDEVSDAKRVRVDNSVLNSSEEGGMVGIMIDRLGDREEVDNKQKNILSVQQLGLPTDLQEYSDTLQEIEGENEVEKKEADEDEEGAAMMEEMEREVEEVKKRGRPKKSAQADKKKSGEEEVGSELATPTRSKRKGRN